MRHKDSIGACSHRSRLPGNHILRLQNFFDVEAALTLLCKPHPVESTIPWPGRNSCSGLHGYACPRSARVNGKACRQRRSKTDNASPFIFSPENFARCILRGSSSTACLSGGRQRPYTSRSGTMNMMHVPPNILARTRLP